MHERMNVSAGMMDEWREGWMNGWRIFLFPLKYFVVYIFVPVILLLLFFLAIFKLEELVTESYINH